MMRDLQPTRLTRQQLRSARVKYKGRKMPVQDYLKKMSADIPGLTYELLNSIYMSYGMEGVTETLKQLRRELKKRAILKVVKNIVTFKWIRNAIRKRTFSQAQKAI